MQPNVGLAAQQEKVVREFRHDLAKIMHRHFEFFALMHPDELNRRGGDLSGAETNVVVETCDDIEAELQKAWKRLARMYDLEPSRMTPRKTEIFNALVAAFQALFGSEESGPGWLKMLSGEYIVMWMNGRIPDEDVLAKIASRKLHKRPMSKAEVAAMLKEKWDAGWRPEALAWVGKWLTNLRLTLFRMFAAAFEFTSEVRIRYLHLTPEQSKAFVHDEPNEKAGDAIRYAMTQEAQRMADDLGVFVQILDEAENIVGEATPTQDIVKVTMSIAVRRGKASRGDWSRRSDVGPSEGRSILSPKTGEEMKANPEQIDFDGAVMVEWSQLI
jgi:hypothetical protein